MNWRTPLSISGDGLLASLITKTLIEDPWYLTNPRLGAPGQLDWYDFPMSDSFHILLLKFVTLWTSSYGLALNAFFILGFFLITCTALFVLHKIGLSYPSSIAGAILYAFAPYHFYRSEGHLFLASYYVIPLTVWLILQVQTWVPGIQPFLLLREKRWPRLTKSGAIAVLICILTGSSGVYYAFFAVILLAAAGLADSLASKSFARVWIALALASLIGFTVILNTAPSAVYSARHGRNLAVASRESFESELYGLKVLQLIFPVAGHRIPVIDHIRSLHSPLRPESESDYSSLGAVATIGCALLLAGTLAGFAKSDRPLSQLGVLTVVSILVGVAGGLGPVFAYFISPQIRAYTRISIYIEFFCLAAFFILLEKGLNRLTANRLSGPAQSTLLTAIVAVVLVIGFFDQVRAPDVKSLVDADTSVHKQEIYISSIENRMPRGAMVLQLPFMDYPESGTLNEMGPYDPIAAYLASTSLRWSYGATRGRYREAWIEDLSTRPASQLLKYAALSGYLGIYVDRLGFKDRGTGLEQSFRAYLNEQPLENGSKRFAFYDLRPYVARLRASYSEPEWQTAQTNVLDPLAFALRGCSAEEHAQDPGFRWRWCDNEARLVIENPLSTTQQFNVKGLVVNGSPGLAHIQLTGSSLNETHSLNPGEFFTLEKRVEASFGQSTIRFQTDGTPLHSPGDGRPLFFRLQQFEVKAASSQIDVEPPKGCYGVEHLSNLDFRWCQSQADLPIDNTSRAPLPVAVRFRLSTGYAAPAEMQIEGPGFSEKVQTTSAGSAYEHAFVLPVGQTHLHIATNAKSLEVPKDSRTLVFQLADFYVEEKIPPTHVIALP